MIAEMGIEAEKERVGDVKEDWKNVRSFMNASVRRALSGQYFMRHFSIGCSPMTPALWQHLQPIS